jgi:hypothetical protein
MQLGSPRPSLDLDDAFADGEDDEIDFKFSRDAIRQDIARHELSWADTEASVDSERRHSFDVDGSISTIDMNGTGPHSRSSSPPQLTLDEDEIDAEFSQISLSESAPNELLDGVATSNDHPYPNVVIDVSESVPDESLDDVAVSNNHPYPNVVINVSKSPTHRVTVSLTSELGGRTSRISDDSPPRPSSAQSSHSGAAASTSSISNSLPDAASSSQSIPPSSSPSVPVPLSPKNPTHRPTRSTGPSALEKVRSKTRPSFLPPKSRQEDNKHLGEWEKMMRLSRASGEYSLFFRLQIADRNYKRKSGEKLFRSVALLERRKSMTP